jgi:glutamate-1-semialdehyde 2,1-aminomutase
VPPEEGFLDLLRRRTSECGALLILDEVISGFRVALGGAQERYGTTADLTVLGKVLGGGLPLAAVAGPRRLLLELAPAGKTYQAGTLSGSPLATAAGLATLRLLTPASYVRLEQITAQLAEGLRQAAARAGVGVQIEAVCGLLTVFFSERRVRSYEDARVADHDAYARFFRSMLSQGIYLPPSPFEAWFPSLAHGDEPLERTLEAAASAFSAAGSP